MIAVMRPWAGPGPAAALISTITALLGRPPRVIPPNELDSLQRQLASPAGRWAYYAELAKP